MKITNNFCLEKLNISSNRLKIGTNKCPKAAEPLRRATFLFITKFPKIPATHLMDPRRMKGWVKLAGHCIMNALFYCSLCMIFVCLFVCLFVFEFWVLNSDRLNKILVASVVYQSRFDGSVKNLDWQIQVGLLIICVRSIPFHALFVLTFHFLLLNFHSIHFELVGDKHCINEISTSSKAKQAVSLCNNLERKTL